MDQILLSIKIKAFDFDGLAGEIDLIHVELTILLKDTVVHHELEVHQPELEHPAADPRGVYRQGIPSTFPSYAGFGQVADELDRHELGEAWVQHLCYIGA